MRPPIRPRLALRLLGEALHRRRKPSPFAELVFPEPHEKRAGVELVLGPEARFKVIAQPGTADER